MSDIATPRIENYYLHPKKYAWRSDNRSSTLEKHTSKEQDISSTIKDRLKMVINSNIEMDINPPNGKLNKDQRSPSPSQTTEDKPLDFSVKPFYSESIQGSELQRTLADFPVKKDNTIPQNSDFISMHPSEKRAPAVPIYNGKTSSSVFNGNSKFKRPKQSPLSDSFPSPYSDTRLQSSHLYPENRRECQTPQHVNNKHESHSPQHMNGIHESQMPKHMNNMYERQSPKQMNNMHESQLLERVNNMNESFSSQQKNTMIERFRQQQLVSLTECRQELNEDASFDGDRQSTPKHIHSLSGEARPDNKHQFADSILRGVLVGTPGEKSQNHGLKFGTPNLNSASSSKFMEGSASSQLFNPHAVPASGLLMPDSNSVMRPGGALIPGSLPGGAQFPGSLPGVAFFNGMAFSPATLNGMNPFTSGNLLPTPLPQNTSGDKKQTKPIRPFKAMANEILCGMHATGLSAMSPVMPPNGYYSNYFTESTNTFTDPLKDKSVPKNESPEMSGNSAMHSSPPCSTSGIQPKPDENGSGDSNISYPDATSSVMDTADASSSRKKGRTLPEEMKDEAYWERRKKNNEAAKRSRDARRQKEDLVAQQAWVFREQNIQLRFQITALEEQNRRTQLQYRALIEQYRTVELQLQLAQDKLSRKRCDKCNSRIEYTENSCCESNRSDSFEA